MQRKDDPVIAIDIGGTKFIAAVIEPGGRIISRQYCHTLADEGPARVIQRLVNSVHNIKNKARNQNIGRIAVAVAGTIDIRNGVVVESPNLPRWHNVRLGDILFNEFGIPVSLINDANAAALGEYELGKYAGVSNLIYLTVSTGIGGGIIINGNLYEGSSGCAGEIGHMIIDVDGPECKCGKKGCLEAFASGTAIARTAKDLLKRGRKSLLTQMTDGYIDAVTAEHVTRAARQGDIVACEAIRTAAHYLGIGLANVVNIFNPDVIVIGGGVSKMGNMILKPARIYMKKYAFKLPARDVKVIRSRLGTDAGLLGAACYVSHERS
ncbi:MAG: ROK family protein [Dehalococcoidia bacterium]|nr:ROK family protein [Dehalococcoidia bacterium]MDD5493383.1 ROK family protein [Dehalococcoidia bacterium]